MKVRAKKWNLVLRITTSSAKTESGQELSVTKMVMKKSSKQVDRIAFSSAKKVFRANVISKRFRLETFTTSRSFQREMIRKRKFAKKVFFRSW